MPTGNAKNFELKLSKTGLMITVFVMAGFLCAAFLIGVDVGKNIDTYPAEIAALPQRALALVWRPAKIKMAQNMTEMNTEQGQPPINADIPGATMGENIDLTYHDALTNKKGLSKVQTPPEKQQISSQTQNLEESQRGRFHIETSKQAPTSAATNSGNETLKETKMLLESSPGKNKYIVQAASLKDKEKAKIINKKITDLGYKSEIVKIEIKGKGMVYRVVAKGFDDKVKAEQAAQKISAKTSANCIVKIADNGSSKN